MMLPTPLAGYVAAFFVLRGNGKKPLKVVKTYEELKREYIELFKAIDARLAEKNASRKLK
jgi:hypothetical protein